MQQLLANLFYESPGIPETIARFCDSLPEYVRARQEYREVADQVARIVGFELYDEFQSRLLAFSDYEVRAYYAFGLHLREALLRELCG